MLIHSPPDLITSLARLEQGLATAGEEGRFADAAIATSQVQRARSGRRVTTSGACLLSAAPVALLLEPLPQVSRPAARLSA